MSYGLLVTGTGGIYQLDSETSSTISLAVASTGTTTGNNQQISGDKTLLGELSMDKSQIEECEVGVYNTEQLSKLLGVLDDDINISGAAGLLQGSSEDFELAAKKQIGDKTFLNLSYKRSFSLNDQSQLGVEYKLNRHFSVVANVGKDGNYNVKYRYKYAY